MDGSFFAFALVGCLVGYIVGDLQRELRYRRDSRSNLALALARTDSNGNGHTGSGPLAGTDSNRNSHTGTLDLGRREARRAAVRGDNGWTRSNPAPAGRYLRSADASPLATARGWEFDGD